MADAAQSREEFKALVRENGVLRARVEELETVVRDLRARLHRNSRNSDQPPSTDKPWAIKPQKPPTGRRPGGQPGHEGTTRQPFTPAEVDRFVTVLPGRCSNCRTLLHAKDAVGAPVRHQTVDLPPTAAEVTEHALQQCLCPDCGTVTQPELPPGVPRGLVGPRLQAMMTLLSGRFRLSRREVSEAIVALYGEKATLSVGTVAAMEKLTSGALAAAYDEALEAVRLAPVVNADETGWTETRKRAWLWCAVTDLLKVFRIDRNRSRAAFERFLGDFTGILGTDRWSAYRALTPEQRQLCWAHLLRNFFGIEERGGEGASLGTRGLAVVDAIMKQWYRLKDGEITRRGFQRLLAPIRARFKRLLTAGLKNSDRKARGLCRDVLKWEPSLWTFAKVPGVDPTNNISEQALRKAVLWSKGSFGSASAAGSRFVERMLTVTESLRAQGRPILAFLEETVRAHGLGGPHPSLLPANTS